MINITVNKLFVTLSNDSIIFIAKSVGVWKDATEKSRMSDTVREDQQNDKNPQEWEDTTL